MSSGCGDVLTLEDLKTAKKHQLFEAEVITGKQGGVASGADIDYATNQATGQTQKTLPAVLRDSGYRPAGFDFTTGGTLAAGDQYRAVLWPSPAGDGLYYFWSGTFPKVIPAGSTPAATGGVGAGAWLPTTGVSRPSSVSFTQFGAKGDGVTNDAPAIAAAFDYALANNVAVVQSSGTFFLDGDTYINIKSLETNLTGSVLKPSATWGGQIVISQPESMVTYDAASAVVSAVNNSSQSSRIQGSAYLDGLANNTDLNGCFVQISTSQPMFIFRDTTYTRVDYNRVYNRGNMENSLRYGIGTNVQSVKALKIRGQVQTVRGLTVDESLSKRYRIVYVNQATRVKLENLSFINKPLTQTFSDTRIEIADSYDVEINGLFAPSVADSFNTTGDMYSYTLGMAASMNVKIKNATANGEGWGATGSNNCANVLFEDCDLSRIDFHMPFQNYLKINRCNIGRWGVLATGIGDLIVTNSSFIAAPDMVSNIISTRPDAGGWFDGDLYMENVTLTGRRKAGETGIAFISGLITSGQGVAPGSPITPTLFNKVLLRDIKLREGSVENAFYTLISVSGADNALLFPKVVDIDGFDFGYLTKSSGIGLNIDWARFKAVYSDMSNSENPVTGRFTSDIFLRNIKTPVISLTSGTTGSFRHNPRVVMENVRHVVTGDGDTTFVTNQRGNYELNSCSIDRIRLYSGSNPNGTVYFKMRGGKLTQPNASLLPIDAAQDTHIVILSRVSISCQFNAQDQNCAIARNLARYSVMQDCDFWDYASGAKLGMLQYLTASSTSLTTTLPLRIGQEFVVASGYTSTSTYTKSYFKVLDSSQTRQVAAIGAGNVIATATVSGNLVSSMLITSPAGNEVVGLYVK